MTVGRFVGAIVVIAVVTPLIFGVVAQTMDDGGEIITYTQYDDYFTEENVDHVSGSLETVQINGTDYVHAKSIGTGTIYYTGGGEKTVDVKKAVLDVFFALGQSNNAYFDVDPTLATPIPKYGTSYYWGTENEPALHPTADSSVGFRDIVDFDTGLCRIGDKAPSFCSTYNDAINHKVYYVNASIGGSSILRWQPDASDLFDAAAEVLSEAMAAVDTSLYDVHIKSYTWIQGEADVGMTIDEYIGYFMKFHKAVMSGDLGYHFQNGIISKIMAKKAPNPAKAQVHLCEVEPDLYLASESADSFNIADGTLGTDSLHYAQLGDNIIGEEVAEAAIEIYFPSETDSTFKDTFVLLLIVPLLMVVGVVLLIMRNRD